MTEGVEIQRHLIGKITVLFAYRQDTDPAPVHLTLKVSRAWSRASSAARIVNGRRQVHDYDYLPVVGAHEQA